MRQTLRTLAIAGGALAAVTCVGATVVALPVPPTRDESQLERASALDRGYGINTFALEAACRPVSVIVTGADGHVRHDTIPQCD